MYIRYGLPTEGRVCLPVFRVNFLEAVTKGVDSARLT